MNLYRPLNNLTGNATYNCSIATPGGPILTWEVGGQQIIVTQQFMDFARRGIYIDPWPTNNTVIDTTLVVSEQARQSYKRLSVQCVARQNLQLDINPCIKVPQVPYNIVSYGESECSWRARNNVGLSYGLCESHQAKFGNGFRNRRITSNDKMLL